MRGREERLQLTSFNSPREWLGAALMPLTWVDVGGSIKVLRPVRYTYEEMIYSLAMSIESLIILISI